MQEQLLETLKRSVSALEEHEVPYLLGGGLACWARGGPDLSSDVDVMIKRADAERALAAVEEAGLRTERPPERWLYKAWDGDILVDLIFEPVGIEMTDEVIGRGDHLNVGGMIVRVMALEDVMVAKLLALDEHAADFGGLIATARALREQIDWPQLRRRTAGSPFAVAFMTLIEELGIVEGAYRASDAGSRVRVLDQEAG